MNTLLITTNIRKEIWEYKKFVLWLPMVIMALFIAIPAISYLLQDGSTSQWMYKFERLTQVQYQPEFANIAYSFISALFVPFLAVAIIVQLYYFLACLYDERQDLSVMFWRSLPVSDATTIGVKLFVGALLIPGIFMLAATITLLIFILVFLVICLVLTFGYDMSLWGLWGSSNVITNVASLWLNLLPLMLWMLPVYGWLMLVSIYARKAPFLWAVLPIVLMLFIEAFVVHYFDLDTRFFADSLLEYFAISHHTVESIVDKNQAINLLSVKILADKVSSIGVMLGAGFIYFSYWLRVNHNQG